MCTVQEDHAQYCQSNFLTTQKVNQVANERCNAQFSLNVDKQGSHI